MVPTRTDKTEIAYSKRANLLIEQYFHECNVPYGFEFEPKDLVRWAIHKRQSLRPSTWRQYRSSLVFHFERLRDDSGNDPKDLDDAIQMLLNSGCDECIRGKDAPRRTSSSKRRSISKQELQLIVSYLQDHKSRWSFPVSIWLQAAVLTGLRPIEWQASKLQLLETGEYTLLVSNAKQSNGRGNGEFRTLHLGVMSSAEHRIINTHLQLVSNVIRQNLWALYYRECRNTLYRTTRALWSNRASYPTLYTGRHQFAANAKQAWLSKPEVAALLGHASIDTATTHYGKRRSGHAGFTVSANESDVARLKNNLPNVLKANER